MNEQEATAAVADRLRLALRDCVVSDAQRRAAFTVALKAVKEAYRNGRADGRASRQLSMRWTEP